MRAAQLAADLFECGLGIGEVVALQQQDGELDAAVRPLEGFAHLRHRSDR